MRKTVQIDAAGRLVIPKEIRDRYGMGPGYPVEIEDTGTEVILRPAAESEVTLRVINGFPVFEIPRASGTDRSDIVQQIAEDRDERVSKILGK